MFAFLNSGRNSLARAIQRRLYPRRRTRLRPAKLAGLDNAFICDCMIRDISKGGLRLVLNRQTDLPEEFYVYDTAPKTLAQVQLRWRNGLSAGVVYLVPPAHIRHFRNSSVRKLAHRLYALDG
ncbi:PilZ domain-containing protein [Roseibium marinum]|uniref:PilZ domain-containing protein n=1 Tax=Roseibium marinum TaxID=281252 RepID=A0A2S3URQ1_9HYPH|nr:PilZ domain-containing protein [Roseibium marinum]POF30159.1 PilZ domain-containing protein [Roseibium marinum]